MATLEQIAALLEGNNKTLRNDIKADMKDENKKLLESINKKFEAHQKDIDSLKEKVGGLQKIEQERTEMDLQKEVKDRRHNVILNNIEEKDESQTALMEKIVNLMNDAVNGIQTSDIDYLYRIGKKKVDGSSRPIVVRFVCLHKKESIMKKWNFFTSKGFQIYEDFPIEIRERRKEILPVIKQLKSKGFKASAKVDKLLVNGEIWSIAKAQEVVDEPPEEMGNEAGQHHKSSSPVKNGKRDRSSPMSPASTPSSQKPKKSLSPLKIQARGTKVFTVPSPRTPKLNAPFVTTPQKNVQITTIVDDK